MGWSWIEGEEARIGSKLGAKMVETLAEKSGE